MKDKSSREVKHVDQKPGVFSNAIEKKKSPRKILERKIYVKPVMTQKKRETDRSKVGIYFPIQHLQCRSEPEIGQHPEMEQTISPGKPGDFSNL